MTNTTAPMTATDFARAQVREAAVNAFEVLGEAAGRVELLSDLLTGGIGALDGDVEDNFELQDDLRAAIDVLARIKAKAGLAARRSRPAN